VDHSPAWRKTEVITLVKGILSKGATIGVFSEGLVVAYNTLFIKVTSIETAKEAGELPWSVNQL
jgi:hypothetical protein